MQFFSLFLSKFYFLGQVMLTTQQICLKSVDHVSISKLVIIIAIASLNPPHPHPPPTHTHSHAIPILKRAEPEVLWTKVMSAKCVGNLMLILLWLFVCAQYLFSSLGTSMFLHLLISHIFTTARHICLKSAPKVPPPPSPPFTY